jgi:glycerol-3-phosphate dehydrogenase (NAD(P)+)
VADTEQEPQRFGHVAIVGDGQMALVLADALAFGRVRTTLVSPFADAAAALAATRESPRLPGFRLDPAVTVTADPAAIAGCDLVVCAIPTQFIRATFTAMAARLPVAVPIVSVAKGIEVETFRLPHDILSESLRARGNNHAIAALSGPTIAAELARRLPAVLVAASADDDLAARVQATFTTPWTRIYSSNDLLGVELAGACKNVIAIAAGIADGLGLGVNAKSALLARGLAEIARVGVALGGKVETFFGVAGAGDLATTCFAPEGRNRSFGERLGRGARVDEALGSTISVVEGVPTARALVALARTHGIELPICETVEAIVFHGLAPRDALGQLMRRATGAERVG